MNAALQQALEALDQEIEAVDQQRADLIGAREHLAKVAGSVGVPSSTKKSSSKAGRTDGRSKPRSRSLPDDAGDHETSIVAAIRKAGGSLKPGELARALGIKMPTLRAWLKPMVKAKTIVVTGVTMSRRISLPGKAPKEAL